jgi:hypothetical protein
MVPTRPKRVYSKAARIGRVACPRWGFRVLWAVLLALHAPALLKTWAALLGGDRRAAVLEGCIWLSFSLAFFTLKIADVPWLAFRTDRRSLTVLLLALVLMHAGPIGVRGSNAAGGEMPAAMLLLAACADRVQLLLGRVRQLFAGFSLPVARSAGWRLRPAWSVAPQHVLLRLNAPRSPPR